MKENKKVSLKQFSDIRGDLYVLEESAENKFDYKSYVIVYDISLSVDFDYTLVVLSGEIIINKEVLKKGDSISVSVKRKVHTFSKSKNFVGLLMAFEENVKTNKNSAKIIDNVPFDVKRIFFVDNVPQNTMRGQHAHKTESQYLVCIAGSVVVELSGYRYEKKRLNAFDSLLLPPMLWTVLSEFKKGTILLVFASSKYMIDEYILDKRKIFN